MYSNYTYHYTPSVPFNSYSPFSTSKSYDLNANQYYRSKLYDDHRYQRKKLSIPAFLIKQEPLYPEMDHKERIGSILDRATAIQEIPKHRFYGQQTEAYRTRVQGKNPFRQNDNLADERMKYLKKSSKSKISTNPNLGVHSYQVLDASERREDGMHRIDEHKYGQTPIGDKTTEDYIAKSILQSNLRKNQHPNRIPEESSSEEDMFYQRHSQPSKQKKNLTRPINRQVPQQVSLRSKTYYRII